MSSFFFVLPVAVLLFVILFFAAYIRLPRPKVPSLVCPDGDMETNFRFTQRRYPLGRRDALPMLLITAVYAFTAFFALGDRDAPESFSHFEDRGYYALVELPEVTRITRVMYYSGLHAGDYYLQFSLDGEEWVDQEGMPQSFADLFKWQYAKLNDVVQEVKYLRIISGSRLDLGELALFDENYGLLDASAFIYDGGVSPLFDEQELVPERPTYMNSAYFDEIYHVRTAEEHIENIYPYEVSHPPLGKIIIGLGIRLFGLCPFGWRFMGTLFGVLMLPLLYIFLKNLFGSTAVASCGTLLFAFDFMHFVQTRIATIDTYGVFFILLMYFFLYRFITAPADDPDYPRARRNLPLFLCGVSFGIGAACKWTVIYAAAGVALIWLIYWIFRGVDLCRAGHGDEFVSELAANIILCAVSFIAAPCVIYYASYYYYGTASGMRGFSMYFKRDYLSIVLDNQRFMFSYHSGVNAEHPYASRWYQWIFDIRPILYYLKYPGENLRASFAAFSNPIVCWGGLLAVASLIWKTIREKDCKALFILIGYLSQLVPWIPISRITFAYHYFPSTVFLVLAIGYMFSTIKRRRPFGWRAQVFGFTAASLALFVLFYPVLTGLPVSDSYSGMLAWIPGMWPF